MVMNVLISFISQKKKKKNRRMPKIAVEINTEWLKRKNSAWVAEDGSRHSAVVLSKN